MPHRHRPLPGHRHRRVRRALPHGEGALLVLALLDLSFVTGHSASAVRFHGARPPWCSRHRRLHRALPHGTATPGAV